MTITNKDELKKAIMEKSLMRRDWSEAVLEYMLDQLSALGFAVVPKNPTWQMEIASIDAPVVPRKYSTEWHSIRAANNAGDMLTKEKA